MNEFIGKWRKFMVDGWENTLNEERYTPNEMSAMSIDKESSSGAFEEGIPDVNTDFSIDTDFGDLSEEEGVVNIGELASELEGQLGVKVKPDRFGNGVDIYPNNKPGDEIYSGNRMAQRIYVKYDGGLKLVAITGYDRSMDLIGEPYNGTSMANQGIWMPRVGKPITMEDLKVYIIQLQRGLESEAKAQSDFYRDRQPD